MYILCQKYKLLFYLNGKTFYTIMAKSFDFILKSDYKEKVIERIANFKMVRQLDHIRQEQKAAVLIPLCKVNGELSLLYMVRSSELRTHRGQVSFPGGMSEENETPTQTALRETNEELGIPEEDIDVWCQGPTIPTLQKINVTMVIGYIKSEIDPSQLVVNKSEVDVAFAISLAKLTNPDYFRYTYFKSGLITPAFLGGPKRVWGLTGFMTHYFLQNLLPNEYKNELHSPIKYKL